MKIDFNKLQINDEQLETMLKLIKEKDKVVELDLSYNDFTKLPNSIVEFTNLEYLGLNDCYNLISLGELKKIKEILNIENCINLKDLGKLEKVGYMIFGYDSGITEEYIKKFKPQLSNISFNEPDNFNPGGY